MANDGVSDSAPVEVALYVADAPLEISELSALNYSQLPTRIRTDAGRNFRGNEVFHDWIEVHNTADVPISLTGVHLTDDDEQPQRWTFPVGTTIGAGEYLVVFASGEDISDPVFDEQQRLHTNFRLAGDGEYVAITVGEGTVIDEIAPGYPIQFRDVTYGKLADQLSYFATATPAGPNVDPRIGRAEEPSLSPERGFYDDPINVVVAPAAGDQQVRYTLDGSPPTPSNGY